MADKTGIEWTDATWNPVIGCAKVSEGCRNCYAMGAAKRIVMSQRKREFGGGNLTSSSPYEKVVKMDDDLFPEAKWNGRAVFLPERLDQPIRWRKPRRIFVNSMSDLFHPDVTFEQIAAVFAVMLATPRHTYQVLTKRPARMVAFFKWFEAEARTRRTDDPPGFHILDPEQYGRVAALSDFSRLYQDSLPFKNAAVYTHSVFPNFHHWPIPNIWLGVSVEDQATADERIPLLLQCPAAVHWISAEPLLGPIDLRNYLGFGCEACGAIPDDDDFVWHPLDGDGHDFAHVVEHGSDTCGPMSADAVVTGLDWVVVGGESGPGARPMRPGWVKSLRDQCAGTGTPYLFKQWGAYAPLVWPLEGADPDEVYKGNKHTNGRTLDGCTHDEYPVTG